MAHSALLVALLVLPAASAERSLGDPAGEPALYRSGPVKGLVTETPGDIDALCSCLEHLVPDLRGRVHPSLCLQRLPPDSIPSRPWKSATTLATCSLDCTTAGDVAGCSSTFVLSVPAAASMRAIRRSV